MTGTPRSAQPSASRSARAWSSARRSTLCSSAYSPAAATIPACRIAPPKRCFSTRALRHQLGEPAMTAPSGAPRPFERQSVTVSNMRAHRRSRDAGRDGRVREPRAVEVHGEPELARDVDHAAQRLDRPDAPARAVVRVLERDDRHARAVQRVGRPDRRPDLLRREHAAIALEQAARLQPGVHGRAAELGDHDVRRSPRRGARAALARGSRARSGSPSSPSAGRRPPPARETRPPRRSSASTVGSSRRCSSPTSAFAIASRMPGDGLVCVSERRSITGCMIAKETARKAVSYDAVSHAKPSVDDLARIYEERYHRLLRVAEAIVGDPDLAHDAVQEAFARRSAAAVVPRRRLARGLGLAGRREHGTQRAPRPAGRAAQLERGRGRDANGHAADASVRALVAALPERQRLVLFLRYYADLDYAAIGEALAISTGTVGATLNQAQRALQPPARGGAAMSDARDPRAYSTRPCRSARPRTRLAGRRRRGPHVARRTQGRRGLAVVAVAAALVAVASTLAAQATARSARSARG